MLIYPQQEQQQGVPWYCLNIWVCKNALSFSPCQFFVNEYYWGVVSSACSKKSRSRSRKVRFWKVKSAVLVWVLNCCVSIFYFISPNIVLNCCSRRSTANRSAMFEISRRLPRVCRKNAVPKAVVSSSLFDATPPRVTLRVFVLTHRD